MKVAYFFCSVFPPDSSHWQQLNTTKSVKDSYPTFSTQLFSTEGNTYFTSPTAYLGKTTLITRNQRNIALLPRYPILPFLKTCFWTYLPNKITKHLFFTFFMLKFETQIFNNEKSVYHSNTNGRLCLQYLASFSHFSLFYEHFTI